MSRIYTAADQLIGHTPLLELTHLEQEFGLKARIVAKLEYFNPAGSMGLSYISACSLNGRQLHKNSVGKSP